MDRENNSYQNAFKKLVLFEEKNNPFAWEIDKISLWWFIRFEIFMKILSKEIGIVLKKQNKNLKNILLKLPDLFYPIGWFFKKVKKFDYLFIGTTNCRRDEREGKYYNIFFDPLIKKLGQNNSLVLEINNNYLSSEKLKKVYSKNLIIIDKIVNKFKILAKLSFFEKKRISKKVNNLLENVDLQNLGITKETLKKILIETLVYIKVSWNFYSKLLDRISPKIIFVTVGYGTLAIFFQLQAKKKGIKVIELQHGIIHHNHPGYILPQVATTLLDKMPLPDFFFLFGEHYKKVILKNSALKENQLIIFGYPYLQEEVKRKIDKEEIYTQLNIDPSKKIILVGSQPITVNFIKNFVLELSNQIDLTKYHIVLSRHPRDQNKDEYKELLARNGITVVYQKPKLYDLFKIAYVFASVFSTTLQEAVAFNVPNIILAYPGYENTDLLKLGGGLLVKTPQEFLQHLENIEKFRYNEEKIKNHFFELKEKDIKQLLKNLKILNS